MALDAVVPDADERAEYVLWLAIEKLSSRNGAARKAIRAESRYNNSPPALVDESRHKTLDHEMEAMFKVQDMAKLTKASRIYGTDFPMDNNTLFPEDYLTSGRSQEVIRFLRCLPNKIG